MLCVRGVCVARTADGKDHNIGFVGKAAIVPRDPFRAMEIDLQGKTFAPAHFVPLTGLKHLRVIHAQNTKVNDAASRRLAP